MRYHYPFAATLPLSSTNLPTTFISLEDWATVSINGQDTNTYLQGQLTNDIHQLTSEMHCIAGHCDAQGKLWSNLRLFHRNQGLAYIERNHVKEPQLAALKKYAVFSNVEIIEDNKAILFGLAGAQARATLASLFTHLPNSQQQVVQQGKTTLLFLPAPSERFIIVTDPCGAEHLYNQLATNVNLNNSEQWLALEIEAGIPIIDLPLMQQMLPQSFNLQLLNAISFDKGCYTGQEMVARAKYRGANKRSLYWLAGQANKQPKVGDELELCLAGHWRKTGIVLASVVVADEPLSDRLWVQAVLRQDLEINSQLRVKGEPNSLLTIQPLPYSSVQR